eukprot:5355617-Amphidinium_carterae.1
MSARWTGRRPGRLADAGSEEGAAGEVTSRTACGDAKRKLLHLRPAPLPGQCTQQAVGPRPAPPVYKDPQHERRRQYDRGSCCGGGCVSACYTPKHALHADQGREST